MRLPQPAKTTFAKRMTLLDRLQPRLAGLPTVTDVAFGNALPFVTVGGYRGMDMVLPRDPSTKVEVQTAMRVVSPEYFRAMRLRVLQGRPLDASDTERRRRRSWSIERLPRSISAAALSGSV